MENTAYCHCEANIMKKQSPAPITDSDLKFIFITFISSNDHFKKIVSKKENVTLKDNRAVQHWKIFHKLIALNCFLRSPP